MRKRVGTWFAPVMLMWAVLMVSGPSVAAQQTSPLRLHGLFTDHAVLQAGREVPVWGTAAPGTRVQVSIGRVEATTRTNQNGRWKAVLPPMKPGGPHRLLVSSDAGQEIRRSDVMCGEVWLAGGQSNMVWLLKNTVGGEQAIADAANPRIRFFQVKRRPSDGPLKEPPGGSWTVSTPESAPVFSATAYYFADYLQKKLNVPVGIIQSAEGGSRVQAWIRREVFEENPALAEDLREMKELRREHQSLVKARNPRKTPTVYYNGMVAPLVPYGIRGVIWYQGEANAKAGDSERYEEALSAMIGQWRSQWGYRFPFLFVQLPEFRGRGMDWIRVREEQRLTQEHVPHTAMVVTLGLGNPENIHPREKRPVGQRLAMAALAKEYFWDLTWSGPLVKQATRRDGVVEVRFDHVGDGLTTKGDRLRGFELSENGEDWVAARAGIDGEKVVVRAQAISMPTAVRYAWAEVPQGNLCNEAGLPASPFEVEVRE